eukprot:58684_1
MSESDYSIFSNYSQRRQMRDAIENYSGVNNIFYGRNWTILFTIANITNIDEFVMYFSEYDFNKTHFNPKEKELHDKMHKIINHYYKWTCYTSYNGKHIPTQFTNHYQYVHQILSQFAYKHSFHITIIGIAYGQEMADLFALICYYFDHQTLWDKLSIGAMEQWNITISGMEINQNFINATPNCFISGYDTVSGYDNSEQFTTFVNYYLNKYYNKSYNIHLETPQWSNFFRIYDDEQYDNQQLLINSDRCQANNIFGTVKNMFHVQRLLNWSRQYIQHCGIEIVHQLEMIERKINKM